MCVTCNQAYCVGDSGACLALAMALYFATIALKKFFRVIGSGTLSSCSSTPGGSWMPESEADPITVTPVSLVRIHAPAGVQFGWQKNPARDSASDSPGATTVLQWPCQ